jgi:hypothetical protein
MLVPHVVFHPLELAGPSASLLAARTFVGRGMFPLSFEGPRPPAKFPSLCGGLV